MPARKGSKRIKRKNLRLIHGRPLLAYILNVATSCQNIDDVVVSTDDQDIAEYAALAWNVKVRVRPTELCGDDVTLDPVVYDAVAYMEESAANTYDIVVTLQPTSPTLKTQTLEKALLSFIASSDDSTLSVVDDTHLRWGIEDGEPIPLYEQRLNRQWLPKTYKETGAFVISRRSVVTPSSRFGKRIAIYPVSREEAIDVDDPLDWLIAEALLSRIRIAFVVTGNRKVGMGHIYRALTLADTFLGNDIRFFGYGCDPRAIQLVESQGYVLDAVTEQTTLFEQLREYAPAIVINDILDTDADYIDKLKSDGLFLVNFEDLGEGSLHANLVFNALYEFSAPPEHHRFGAKYVCLGESFLLLPPAPFRDPAATLLITFGGSDENNLTGRTCEILPPLLQETTLERVLVVLGPAYAHHQELNALLESSKTSVRSCIHVYSKVENMASLIREADIAVTSNGRTVYELAAMGVPGVSVSQNDRETLHLFSRYSTGFRYIGIASNVGAKEILAAVEPLVMDRDLRKRMRGALLAADLRAGIRRIREEILGQYWRWKYEDSNNW